MRRFIFVPALIVAVAVFTVAAGAAWLASGTGGSFSRSTNIGKPTNVAATATGASSVQVTWAAPAAPSPPPASYDVFRYFNNTGTKICSATTNLTCNDTGLQAGSTYGYTVEARLGANWLSGQTTQVNATTNAAGNFLVELVTPGNKTAGTAFDVRVTARNGTTTDTTYTGPHNLTFSGPGQNAGFANGSPTYPASGTFTAGVATVSVTLRKAETATLTVAEAARTGNTSVTVVAGAASLLRYTTSSKDCSSGSVALGTNGGTWTSRVTRYDGSGNPVTTGTLSINVSKPSGAGGNTPTTPLSIANGASESGTATSYTIASGQPPAVTITAASNPAGLTSATCDVDR